MNANIKWLPDSVNAGKILPKTNENKKSNLALSSNAHIIYFYLISLIEILPEKILEILSMLI